MQISPDSPSGTALSLSSRSSMSVDGIGRPIAPLYSVMSSGFAVAAGALKLAVPGDFGRATAEEVQRLVHQCT